MFSMKYTLLLLFCILLSCDRPHCTDTNTVFSSNTPESSIYKFELKNQIQKIGSNNLRYWLKAYVENTNEDYLLINVQNDSLCAIMKLSVPVWDKKIEHIRDRKGVGRRGAELSGLQYSIVARPDSIDFIYKGLDYIID